MLKIKLRGSAVYLHHPCVLQLVKGSYNSWVLCIRKTKPDHTDISKLSPQTYQLNQSYMNFEFLNENFAALIS